MHFDFSVSHGGHFIVLKHLITILDEGKLISLILSPEPTSLHGIIRKPHRLLPFHLIGKLVHLREHGRALLRVIIILHHPTILGIELLPVLGGHHVVHIPLLFA